jgi:hypothetical protein
MPAKSQQSTTVVNVIMTNAGNIYKSVASDAANTCLIADAADRTTEIYV